MNNNTLYAVVCDKIRKYIKDNELESGSKLPGERSLSEMMGVSRSTVREAIRELQNEGVVKVKVGKGTFVTDYIEGRRVSLQLAIKNFLELFEIKTVLERYSLEHAIPVIPMEKLEYLDILATNMVEIAATGVMPKEMDHEFHGYIVNCYGNKEMKKLVINMIKMYETFDDEVYSHFDAIKYDYMSELLKTFPYHLEMVKRMKKRDVIGALEMYDKVVELDVRLYKRIL